MTREATSDRDGSATVEAWPELPFEEWRDTCQTLHMWMQAVGKVKLELCPFLNQWWEVAFHLTARGMTTGLIPWKESAFDIEFDFTDHHLRIRVSDGRIKELSLEPRAVADFYRLFMQMLRDLGINLTINTTPSEIPNPIPFEQDTAHASYDAVWVQRWWRVQLSVAQVIERYRTPFHGKSSPVNFFWGSFDLAETRFNGKPADPPNYGGTIMRYGEDAENFAIGFWPGSDQFPHAALYAYMYPAPAGTENARIRPRGAGWNPDLGEFVFPYEEARKAPDVGEAILEFFQSTYEANAALAGWDRATLEGNVPKKWQIQ